MLLKTRTIIKYVKWFFLLAKVFLNVDCQKIDDLSLSNPNGSNYHSFLSYTGSIEYVNSNFSYQKCFCDLQEIWKDGSCLPAQTDIVLPLLQTLHPESTILFSFIFSSVNIRDINCGDEKLSLTLINDNLFLLETGELYSEEIDLIISKENYCFEFVDEKESTSVIAKVCVDRPSLPICQSQHDTIQDPSSFNINVSFASYDIDSSNLSVLKISELQCKNKPKISLPLEYDKKKFSFHFISNNIELIWQPPFPATVPEVFFSGEYCIFTNDSFSIPYISFCYDDPQVKHDKLCSSLTCVRKCCPKYQIYNSVSRSCTLLQDGNHITDFSFYNFENQSYVQSPKNLFVEYNFPWCENDRPYIIDPTLNPSDNFFLLENGSLYITLSKVSMPPSLYCVDSFLDSEESLSIKAISCFLDKKEETNKCKEIHRVLYPVLIVISCIFLSITLIVYAVIPELHAKLHGKSLLSHVFSLLIAFLCQLIVVWRSKSLSMTGCKLIALGNQVSFLWAFFWLNVMCFDIWWTLKRMSPVPESGESWRRRFALYSVYAWGCPIVICFVTALMEFLPQISQKNNLILPQFGVRGCWFQDVKSTWIYFHGFTLSLYVLNIFFFFHVAAILIKGQRSTEGILRTTRKQHKERIFTDIINSLQGVMIFCIFMWSKKVFQKVKAKSVPLFVCVKSFFRTSSSDVVGVTRANSSSQRTIQTSDEVSLR
ncbi:putative G-protein coupled receptor Mth-like 1 [Armadillidium nasatum]|uniref:Putative G-protein coupled receptor Mth-like 1 n=1 Tax=Armadillidium nasatum TaxID=96803 RepID=A0A5N5TJH9_9CRUS|nr:putative G-protein coupled receptor Mth-like 1 [Armadillidium nasatum]